MAPQYEKTAWSRRKGRVDLHEKKEKEKEKEKEKGG